MAEKKQTIVVSPDVTKMQEVRIDNRTKIYIGIDEDPKQAKERYLARLEFKKP